MSKITIVDFSDGERVKRVRTGLNQWDYGQILRIQGLNLPSAVQIHFSLQEKGGEAKRRIGITKDGVTDVLIPDFILEADITKDYYEAYVFIYQTDEDSGETTHKIIMTIKTRPMPEGFDSSDETTFDAILEQVKKLVDGAVDEETIEQAVSEYLTEHPIETGATAEEVAQIEKNKQAITALEKDLSNYVDETLTESGKAADAKAVGEKFSQLSQEIEGLEENGTGGTATKEITSEFIDNNKFKLHYLGDLYEKPSNYVAWGGSMMYEPKLGKFVQWLYCTDKHIHSTAELYVVYIDKKTMNADEPIHCVYYDTDGTTQLSFDNEAGITVRVLEDGTYQLIKSIKNGTATNFFRFNSNDYGKTWVKGEQIAPPSGVGGFDYIIPLSNGRLITSYGGPIFYSDNDGKDWTVTKPQTAGGDYEAEAYFCELKKGVVMAIARYSKSGGTNGDGTPDSAIIAYSYDYGTTWTPWKKSETILDMNAMGCYGIMHDGFVELFVMTRWYDGIDAHTETGKWGAIYQYTASVDEALNDNFTNRGIIYYSKASYAQDFSSPDFAIDDDGDMLFSVADGDETVSDVSTKFYLRGTRDKFFPTVDDSVSNTFKTYSSSKLDKIFSEMKETIYTLQYALSKIEGSGVNPPEGDGETVIWTATWEASEGAMLEGAIGEYAVARTGASLGDAEGQDSLGNDVRLLKNYHFIIPYTKENVAIELKETWEGMWQIYSHVGVVIDDLLNLYCLVTNSDTGVYNASNGWEKKFYAYTTPVVVTKRIVKRGDSVTCTLIVGDEVILEEYDLTQHTLLNSSTRTDGVYPSITEKCMYMSCYPNATTPVHHIKFGEWD